MTNTMVSHDMMTLLHNGNVGKFPGLVGGNDDWPIYIGYEPEEPDDVVVIYDAPGSASNPKFLLDEPRFLCRVRSDKYVDGWQKADEIKQVLLGLPSQDINGIRYVGIWGVIDTHFLTKDKKGRSIFVNTWRTIREPITSNNRQTL